MGNKTHQLEPATYRAGELITLMTWLANRDGQVCAVEQRGIEIAHALREDIVKEVATDNFIAYVQKGAEASRYANQLAARLGLRLVTPEEGCGIEDEPLDAA